MAPKTIIGHRFTCSEMKQTAGRSRSCVLRATNVGTISLLQTPTVGARHNIALNLRMSKLLHLPLSAFSMAALK